MSKEVSSVVTYLQCMFFCSIIAWEPCVELPTCEAAARGYTEGRKNGVSGGNVGHRSRYLTVFFVQVAQRRRFSFAGLMPHFLVFRPR